MDEINIRADDFDEEYGYAPESAETDCLEPLREKISKYISGYRLEHTLSVERECRFLAKLFQFDAESTKKLCTAALLHDITKEKTLEENLELCRRFNIFYRSEDIYSPKIFHAFTGAYFAKEQFPEYVDRYVFDAIYNHTTGCEEMRLYDKLLYLADYIEPERTFESCVELRKYFYSHRKTKNRFYLLNDTLILSFDMTIKDLLEAGEPVCVKTIEARNYLICEKLKRK